MKQPPAHTLCTNHMNSDHTRDGSTNRGRQPSHARFWRRFQDGFYRPSVANTQAKAMTLGQFPAATRAHQPLRTCQPLHTGAGVAQQVDPAISLLWLPVEEAVQQSPSKRRPHQRPQREKPRTAASGSLNCSCSNEPSCRNTDLRQVHNGHRPETSPQRSPTIVCWNEEKGAGRPLQAKLDARWWHFEGRM